MSHPTDDQTMGQKRSQRNALSDESLIDSKASQIQAALAAAKNLAAYHDALRQRAALPQAGLAQHSPILRTNQRTAERLFTSLFEKLGFDFDKFAAIQAQNRAESCRILESRQAAMVKQSAEAKAAFRSAVDSRREIIKHLIASTGTAADLRASRVVLPTSGVVLDAPFMISAEGLGPVTGSSGPWEYQGDIGLTYHIEPWNSWAKFKIDDATHGDWQKTVNFYFYWENSSDHYVVVDVDSWLTLHGFLKGDIPGHLFDTEKADIEIHVSLNLWEEWNDPFPTTPGLGPLNFYPDALLLTLEKVPFGSFVSPQTEVAFRRLDLRFNLEFVPPGGGLLFVVGPEIVWQNRGGGGIVADFDTKDFEVMCPFLSLGVIDLPVFTN
jgi:hypothetical protein